MFINHALEPNEVSFVKLIQVFTDKDLHDFNPKNVPEPKDSNS